MRRPSRAHRRHRGDERRPGAGGTSFDALYVNVNGASGYFDRSLDAYGQADRPCPRCGTPIRREAFMNRGSFSCPRCQPRPRARQSQPFVLERPRTAPRDSRRHHEQQRERVAQRPAQLGHQVEVHAVDRRDERRREEDRRPRRDALDLLVLLEARLGHPGHLRVLPLTDECGVDLQDVGEQVAETGQPLDHPRGVVGDVAQVAAQLQVGALGALFEGGAQRVEEVASGSTARWKSITSRDSW